MQQISGKKANDHQQGRVNVRGLPVCHDHRRIFDGFRSGSGRSDDGAHHGGSDRRRGDGFRL